MNTNGELKRNGNGMSTAIAMHGSRALSKRAKRANDRLLAIACFGTDKITREMITGETQQPTVSERSRSLRHLATMASKRQAKILLQRAEALESGGAQ